ncbi:MAG: helix-turn-helix domain-containing protein [Bifidobacteriaceae bacterium]|jgi:DNA-binding XRE family transcriptional regulator|nr:helix-turn-helix domain-containing protein [Bifidobacteriaceae bacterium]
MGKNDHSTERQTFIAACDAKVKLVRVEAGLTQDAMAHALGLSKKTLVDIEKGRRTLGWTGSVALCLVFGDSEVIAGTFGGTPVDLIQTAAFAGQPVHRRRVTGSPTWWTAVMENDRYILQQNVISQHYRIITHDKTRIASAFDLDELLPIFNHPLTEGQ